MLIGGWYANDLCDVTTQRSLEEKAAGLDQQLLVLSTCGWVWPVQEGKRGKGKQKEDKRALGCQSGDLG